MINADSSFGLGLTREVEGAKVERIHRELERICELHLSTDSKLLTFVEQLDQGEAAMMAAILKMHNFTRECGKQGGMEADVAAGAATYKAQHRARLLKLAVSWNRSAIVQEQLKMNYEEALSERPTKGALRYLVHRRPPTNRPAASQHSSSARV